MFDKNTNWLLFSLLTWDNLKVGCKLVVANKVKQIVNLEFLTTNDYLHTGQSYERNDSNLYNDEFRLIFILVLVEEFYWDLYFQVSWYVHPATLNRWVVILYHETFLWWFTLYDINDLKHFTQANWCFRFKNQVLMLRQKLIHAFLDPSFPGRVQSPSTLHTLTLNRYYWLNKPLVLLCYDLVFSRSCRVKKNVNYIHSSTCTA